MITREYEKCSGLLKALRLRYSTPELIFLTVNLDHDVDLRVIGGDCEGAYEWVIDRQGDVSEHSDCGYGIAEVALRDGLIAYHGLPSPAAPNIALAKACAPWFDDSAFRRCGRRGA